MPIGQYNSAGDAAIQSMLAQRGRSLLRGDVDPLGQALMQIWDNRKDAMQEAALLRQMYDNDWADQLKAQLKARFTTDNYKRQLEQLDWSLNIIRNVVRKQAGAYKRPPTRSLRQVEDPGERFAEYQLETAIDAVMLQADRQSILLQDVLIGPHRPPVFDSFGNVDVARSILQYRIIGPDCYCVIERPGNATQMQALVYSFVENTETWYAYWSDSEHIIFDQNWQPQTIEENPDNANPFGVIPFAVMRPELATDRFFHLEQSRSLRSATMNAGVERTDLGHLQKYNSHKQLAIGGGAEGSLPPQDKNGDVVEWDKFLDPSRVPFTGPFSASVIDMGGDIENVLEVIWNKAAQIASLHGINPKSFEGNTTASSGYELKLQDQDLSEVHDEIRRMREMEERQLYNITVVVNNYYADRGSPWGDLPEGILLVEFAEIGAGEDPKLTLERWIVLEDRGYCTHIEAIMATRNVDEEEARSIDAAVRAEQAEAPTEQVEQPIVVEDDSADPDEPLEV